VILFGDFSAHNRNDAGASKGVISQHGDANLIDNSTLLLYLLSNVFTA